MNAGDIKTTLTLENGSFKIELQKAGVLLKQFERNLESTAKSVKKIEEHTTSFSARMRYAITSISLARGALSNLNFIFLGLPTSIARASGEIERMQKLMTGLAKSSQDVVSGNKTAEETAQGWTSYIFELSKNAPFEVNAISDSFVKLKTAGLDPTDGSLQSLIDSVAKFGGTSEQLKRASVAIQQMGGKGVISMEELRQQLGEAVPDAMQNMAVGTGMSMAELVKAISKGTVESRSALDRMFTVMRIQNEGAAQAMIDTWTGQLAKLKTQFTLFLNEAGNAGGENSFFATIKKELKEINALFDTPDAKRFAAELGRGLSDITKNIAATVKFVAQFSTEIKSAAQAMVVFWAASKGVAIYQEIARRLAAAKEAAIAYQTAQTAMAAKEVQEEINKNKAIIAQNAAKYARLKAMQEQFNAQALARRIELDRIEQRQGYIGTLSRNYRETSNDASRLAANAAAAGAAAERVRQLGMETARLNAEKATMLQRITATTSKLPILGTALNLLGGPIGIITTLLTAGAFAWFEWGRNAENAIKNANDAIKQGNATEIDVATVKKQLDAQNKIFQQRAEQIKKSGQNVSQQEIQELQRLGQQVTELENKLAQAKQQARNNGLKESVRLNQQYNDVFLDQSKTRQEQELAALKAATEKQKNEAEKAGKSLTDIERKYSAEFKRISQDRLAERSKYLESSIKLVDEKIAKATTDKQKEAFDAQKKNLQKIKNDIDAELAAVGRLGSTRINSASDPNAGADTRAVKLSPIQAFIEKLREQDAQVKASRDALLEGKEAVKSYVAEFEVKLKQGEFNGKKSGAPNQQEIEMARSMAEQLDRDLLANNKLNDFNNFMDSMKEKIAALNGELAKNNGEGAVQRLIEKMNQGGFNTAQIEQATAKIKEYQDAFEAKNIDQAITATEQNIAALKEKIEGGASAVGKLNLEIERLGKANLSGANLQELERLRVLAREQERLQSEDTLRDLRFTTDAKLREVREGNATESELIQIRYERERAEIERTFQLSKVYGAARVEAERLMNIQLKALEEQRIQQMRSPAERMVRQWEDVTQRMREASADWTSDFIDKLAEGNLKFGDFVEQMLMDIYKIQLRKQLGGAVQGIFDAVADGVSGISRNAGQGGGVSNTLVDTATSTWERLVRALGFGKEKVDSFGKGVAETAVETAIQTTNSASASTALQAVQQAATNAAAALNQLASSGGSAGASSGGGGGFFDGIFDAIGGLFGGGGYEPLPDFVPAFAKGGIMTKFGEVPLRAYQNGGIATRPQMALYGEGSRPEAFVPLPDGRTIPVTLAGGMGGGSNVTVNVINAPEGTRTEQSRNQDGSMNIDVIIGQVEGKISQNLSKGRGTLAGVMEKTYGLSRTPGAY